MAEVRVKIGADVKDLQKGVQTAENELRDLAKTAQRAAGSTDDLAASTRGIVQGMGGAARASSGARVALTDLNRVVSDAPFGFVAVQNNIDQLAASFGSLVRESGGVKNALKAIATSFSGPAGILTLLSLAGSAALIFGDKISAAFNKGAVEAERAQQAIKDAFDEVAKFNSISGVSFDETTTKAAIPSAKERLSLEQATSEAIQKQIADIDRQISKTNQLGAAQAAIAANQDENLTAQRKALLDQLQGQTLNVVAAQRALDGLEAQNAAYDAQNQTQKILVELGGTLETQAEERVKQLRGQTDEAKAQAKAIADAAREQEQLNKLRAQAFAAVGAPTPFIERGRQEATPEALPGRPDKVFDETAINDFFDAQERIRLQQAAINAQLAQGNDIFTEFGVSGVAALADVALGFERLEDLGTIVADIVKGLIKDLAVAAAKAALINLIFPGAGLAAGGVGGLLKGFLGFGGGIGAAPAQSLAGISPVASLGTLSQATTDRETFIPELTIRGNDLVVAFQRARAGSARTLGNIPLK